LGQRQKLTMVISQILDWHDQDKKSDSRNYENCVNRTEPKCSPQWQFAKGAIFEGLPI
jgi:hypothetical protein